MFIDRYIPVILPEEHKLVPWQSCSVAITKSHYSSVSSLEASKKQNKPDLANISAPVTVSGKALILPFYEQVAHTSTWIQGLLNIMPVQTEGKDRKSEITAAYGVIGVISE